MIDPGFEVKRFFFLDRLSRPFTKEVEGELPELILG